MTKNVDRTCRNKTPIFAAQPSPDSSENLQGRKLYFSSKKERPKKLLFYNRKKI